MKGISLREWELPDAIISKLIRIAVEDHQVISLGPGEPDFVAPKPIVRLVKKYASKCNHYSPPGGREELKEAIVAKVKRENHIKSGPENVIVTCGSQEAMLLATASTLDVSQQIIVPNPGFMGYVPLFELFDVNPVGVKLQEENSFEVQPDDIKELINKKKTKAILLNSPANPTGNVIRKKILEEIADIAVEHDLYVFSDEAYEKIIYDAKHVSFASLNGMSDRTLTFQSFSKSYAMCGFRLGYCVGPQKVIEAMTKTHVYSTISAPTISQMVGTKVLGLSPKYTTRMVRDYAKRRKVIVNRLNGMGLSTPMPQGAFYTFSNISAYSKNSYKFSSQLLQKGKVAVVPGTEFGTHGEGYIRCSYATRLHLIEQAMDRMEKFLRKS